MIYKVTKRISKYCKPYTKNIILAIISAIVNIVSVLAIPVFIGMAIDNILDKNAVNYAMVFYYLVIVGVFVALACVFQWIMNVNTQKLAFSTARDFRLDAFAKLNHLPISYIDKSNHGDIISRLVNDAQQVSDGLQQAITQFLPGVITIFGTLIVMLILNPVIALVVVLITPLSIFMATFITRKTRQSFVEKAKLEGEIMGFLNERVQNQVLVKAFGNEQASKNVLKEMTDMLFKVGLKAQFYSSISNPCTRFVNSIVYVAVCVIGALSVIKGGLTVGQLSSFLAYANQYTKPFNEISDVLSQLQIAAISAERLFFIIDEQAETPDTKTAVDKQNSDGVIKIENVSFSYTKDVPLIKNFNLEVKKGQKIAIVGPTGCGKTTIINLLMRFYDVDNGRILIDGINIKDIQRNSLRSLYGMVLQETWLQHATVAENIAYADKNATKEQIITAAKAAYAHSFIKRLPQGYDTVIQLNGSNLSLGQRQLLSIARIMLAQPKILILDESTSSIDTRTEILIGEAFNKLMKDRTSFVVAHRLSTIQTADVILVMEDGDIIEKGTHKQLIKQNGFYAKLFNSQFAEAD